MSKDEIRSEQNPCQPMLTQDGYSAELPAPFVTQGSLGGLSWGLRLLSYMLSGLRIGTLDVEFPNGARRHFVGDQPGPRGVMRIKSDRLVRHVLSGGEVGFGDAYLDDCWDSPDLARLLMVLYLNEPHYKGPFEKNLFGQLYGYWQHRRRDNTKRKARENIEAHYDLGNAFYQLWLDETMAYSSGMFASPNDTLMQAQINKFRLM
jgi:cyclopropane-fatty-acyl-phospholipid synthase